jgi:hypothetical protein
MPVARTNRFRYSNASCAKIASRPGAG